MPKKENNVQEVEKETLLSGTQSEENKNQNLKELQASLDKEREYHNQIKWRPNKFGFGTSAIGLGTVPLFALGAPGLLIMCLGVLTVFGLIATIVTIFSALKSQKKIEKLSDEIKNIHQQNQEKEQEETVEMAQTESTLRQRPQAQKESADSREV